MKIYGPYTRKDGRQHVILIDHFGFRTTKSYPRYLMEKHLGRDLEEHETIDHIDEDYQNNSINNLQILSRKENASKTFKVFPERRRKYITFNCPVCGKESTKPLNRVKGNRKRGSRGPYCGRSCAGKDMHI
jgi:hypothetical protein